MNVLQRLSMSEEHVRLCYHIPIKVDMQYAHQQWKWQREQAYKWEHGLVVDLSPKVVDLRYGQDNQDEGLRSVCHHFMRRNLLAQ
jgi:hypothetical protein